MADHPSNKHHGDSVGAFSDESIEASTWADIDSTLSITLPNARSIDASSLDDLLGVYECLDLLNRVWPADKPSDEERETDLPPVPEIGPYVLLNKIGQGGMGTVWEAKQEEPIQRRLAIKLISAPHSASVNRRFEAERNMLAIMNHPNIARILDAGTTDDGHMFFAMELVQGDDVYSFCNQQQLNLRQRLDLFLDVCSAVQHAHQNGIIHRDLKPSNVLVDTSSSAAVVKVIDFGLAKVFDQTKTDLDNDATKAGQILGSLWYMSPEQAGSLPVDTRTDVYSLGVVLYQLLTGVVPLNKNKLKSTGLSSILHAIQHEEPQRPSQRLLSSDDTKKSSSDPNLLSNLKGDLDWVVMRALEKDKDRRYSTVQEFATDIRRFLNNESVEARPPSTWYSLQTFARRHRTGVAVGFVLLTALIFCAVVATWGLIRVSKANEDAADRLAQARQSNEVLQGIFSDLDFDSIEAVSTPLRMRLAKRLVTAAEQLEPGSVGDPIDVARVQLKLGQTLNSLGFYKEACPICSNAYAAADDEFGLNDPLTREAGRELVRAYLNSGNFTKSEELLTLIMDYCDSELGTNDGETLETRHLLGEFHAYCGDYQQSMANYRIAADGRARLFGEDALPTLESRMGQAFTTGWLDDGEKAAAIIEGCIGHLRKKLRAGHPRTVKAMLELAWAYGRTSRREEAVAIAKEAFELSSKTYGPKHEATYNAQVQVGLTAYGIGRYDEARENLETAISGLESSLSRESRSAVIAGSLLARLYRTTGQPHRAMPIMETNLRIRQSKLPPNHTTVLTALNELADFYKQIGDYQQARVLLTEALANTPADSPDHFQLNRTLASTYFEEGSYAEAVEAIHETRVATEKNQGHLEFNTLLAYADEAKALSANGQGDEAIALLQPYLSDVKASNPPGFHEAIITAQLGIVMADSDRVTEGIELMESVVQSRVRLKKMNYLIENLRNAYAKNGEPKKAASSIQREVQMHRRRLSSDSVAMGTTLNRLGTEATKLGLHDDALEMLNESVRILDSAAPESWHFSMARMQRNLCLLLQATDNDGEDTLEATVAELEQDYDQLSNWREDRFPNEQRGLANVVSSVATAMKNRSMPEAEVWEQRTN